MDAPWEPQATEIRLVDVLDALADPVRLALVARLADLGGEKCTDINADMNVHKSTMSHHYRVLREAGVTRTDVHGRQRWVTLRHAELNARFPGLLDSVLSAATHPAQPNARNG